MWTRPLEALDFETEPAAGVLRGSERRHRAGRPLVTLSNTAPGFIQDIALPGRIEGGRPGRWTPARLTRAGGALVAVEGRGCRLARGRRRCGGRGARGPAPSGTLLTAMTATRLLTLAGTVALLALLVVGLVQLAGARVTRRGDGGAAHPGTGAGAVGRLPGPARSAARAGRRSAGRGRTSAAGAPCRAAGVADRDKQVGLLVWSVQGGVRRLPARRR